MGRARGVRDLVVKFLEHFAAITEAIDGQGMWDDADGLYYDRLLTPGGTAVPVKVRSMVGIIPALAAAVIDEPIIERSRALGKHFADLLDRRGPATAPRCPCPRCRRSPRLPPHASRTR